MQTGVSRGFVRAALRLHLSTTAVTLRSGGGHPSLRTRLAAMGNLYRYAMRKFSQSGLLVLSLSEPRLGRG
jgi:hypothetical protein